MAARFLFVNIIAFCVWINGSDKVILLICPIFNPHGHEKISTLNRTDQNGPVNGMGVRYNGQFLDINRDAMKELSPEVRGLLTAGKGIFSLSCL
jgi:hypothetical protein